jgi:hypothetical protein
MEVLMSKRFGLGLRIRDDLPELDSTYSKKFRIRPEPDQNSYFMEMVNVPDAQDLLLVPNFCVKVLLNFLLNFFAS